MGDHVGFESWLERDHAMLLDFQVDVVALASQPFWLSWRHEDRTRRHVPDFFARQADGSGVVIDVRPDDQIQQADAEAFDATARAEWIATPALSVGRYCLGMSRRPSTDHIIRADSPHSR
ncbi:hypothetical protein GCM10022255_115500 [Dactylosporangium darangshiense]|uniref:Uncharacterized protein n=2 Tax=Dactylosporangium darangshiense TaxID=579108 RepID=A0ABP8DW88_9ACTN